MIAALFALTYACVPLKADGTDGHTLPVPPPLNAWESDEVRHATDMRVDSELGLKDSREVAKELTIVDDPVLQARVDRIGHELAAIADKTRVVATYGDRRLNPFDYSFRIVLEKDKKHLDEVNAFSVRGGYIYVFKGLLDFCESDDELAGVLGHEIAHAAFRHVAFSQQVASKLNYLQLPLILASILSGGAAGAMGAISVGGTASTAIQNGWGVKAEEAADYGGFQYLMRTHYNPTGMLTFMERLAWLERKALVPTMLGIYRTHPPSEERAKSLTNYMKLAGVPIQRSRVAHSFRAEARLETDDKVPLTFGDHALVQMAGSDARARAESAAVKLNDFFDSVPEPFEAQVGDNGTIVSAGHRTMVALTAADAAAAGKTLPELQAETLKRIRASLLTIGYRVWDAR